MSENQRTDLATYMKSETVMQNFTEVLGNNREANGYIMQVLVAVANSSALQQCTPQSIYTQAIRAATRRLSVDPATRQAYLVPFKNQCTLIVGWKGLYDMALRTGQYRALNVAKVYKGQEPIIDQLTGRFTGWDGRKESDEIIGYVGYFELLNGFQKAIYMTVQEIHEHKEKYSKGFNREDSAWKTATIEMEKKTVYRQLLKYGYFNEDDKLFLDQSEDPAYVDDDVPAFDVEADFIEEETQTADESISDLGFTDKPKSKRELTALMNKIGMASDVNDWLKEFSGDSDAAYKQFEKQYAELLQIKQGKLL